MTSLPPKYRKLSKYLSYILRHHPEEADLSIDKYGFAELSKVLEALKKTKHSWADKEDIEELIERSEKIRFEIKEDKIRALYGHSIDVEIEEEVNRSPPETLYHGTSPRSAEAILEEGIKSKNRQFVHLSKTEKEAYRVGKRHHGEPIILQIDAEKAWEEGISFYKRGDVFLVEYMPPEYVDVSE
ncbi:MAG: RNA 2'-phosphotransferase [Candidatus Thermoplasmatota archaeon]